MTTVPDYRVPAADIQPLADLLPGYSLTAISQAVSQYGRGHTYGYRIDAEYGACLYTLPHHYGRHTNIYSCIRHAHSAAELADVLRYRIGRAAAHDLWDSWLAWHEEQTRRSRDMAALLRHPVGREACRKAAVAGKAYSADAEQFARRPVVRQAVALLAERLARREAAKRTAPVANRIADECQRRKIARVVAAVKAAARGLYRVSESRWAGGDHTTEILVGEQRWKSAANDGTAIGADGQSYREWSSNRKWSGTSSRHVFQVRLDWCQAVEDRDLAVCDGMLTLDARPVQGVGPELYEAVWVEQGRGVSLNAVRGYIARIDTTTYHARSARAALDGVQRKAGLKPARRKGVVDLDRLARRHGDLPVYWSDRDGIACVSGSRSWCHAVGIDPEGTTVAELVRGYKLRPMPEVIQVIRRVVRDRANRQPIDLSVPPSNLEGMGRVVFDSEGGFRVLPSDN